MAAWVRSSCILEMLPILFEVPYTVNMKTKMIANRTVVWELLDQVSLGRKVHRGVLLVAKKGRTHTTSDDVDTDTKGNEEARLESSYNQSQSHYKANCRTLTAMVLIPVRAVTVALPPRHNIELTTMLVARPKKRKTICAKVPQRVPMISRKVWALGAFNLSLAASWAKRRT